MVRSPSKRAAVVFAMVIEACPFCGVTFDEQQHRYNPAPLQRMDPVKAADGVFTVRCPDCAEVCVSSTVKFLGFVTRRTYFGFFLVLLVAIVLFVGFANSLAGTWSAEQTPSPGRSLSRVAACGSTSALHPERAGGLQRQRTASR